MSYSNSTGSQRITPVVLNLIIINALVWLAQITLDRTGYDLSDKIALFPPATGLFKPYQLVTHFFAHAALDPQNGSIILWHILFNMYALWMFGTWLEKVWGPKRFLIFYFVCGLAAGLTQMLLVKDAPALGASGAIMGLMGAFAVMFPNVQFFIIPIPVPIKAKYLVMIYAAIDLFGGLHPGALDDVAHFAHLGGLVVGLIITFIWKKTNKKTFY